MITKIFSLGKKKDSTEFSKFIREASSREKKKVFMTVIKQATEDQKKIIKESDLHQKAA